MTTPARTSETMALLRSLRDGGYGNEAHAETIASVKAVPNSLSLRAAISHASWENPNGEPVGLGAHDKYLHDLPRAQAKAIIAVQDLVAKRRLGRGLLGKARAGGVDFGFGRLMPDVIANYDHAMRRQSFNSQGKLQERADDFIGAAANSTAHELAHCHQLAVLGERLRQLPDSADDLTIQLDHRLLANRHLEAAANAVAIQVAYDNLQAGDNRMWRALSSNGVDNHQQQAFEAAIAADPAAAKNGVARRAAHDAFFDLTDYIGKYDDQLLMVNHTALRRLAKQQRDGYRDMGDRMRARSLARWEHSEEELGMLGDMPDGINHLTLPGTSLLHDEKYSAPTSERRAGQTLYLMGLAEHLRMEEIVTMQDVDKVVRIQSRTEAADILAAKGPLLHSTLDLKRWRSKARTAEATPPKPTA